jgi:hypothetical protein
MGHGSAILATVNCYILSYCIVSYLRMTDYMECPFCDRIYEAEAYVALVHQHPLEAHIRSDHHMVRVRKGSNYRWVPEQEVRARLAASRARGVAPVVGK